MKEILSERTIQEQGSYKRVERYYKGHHPELGQLTVGYTGNETIAHEDVIKPVVTVTVLSEKEHAWVEAFDYPMQWSVDLAKRDDEIGRDHKVRLRDFEIVQSLGGIIYERDTE